MDTNYSKPLNNNSKGKGREIRQESRAVDTEEYFEPAPYLPPILHQEDWSYDPIYKTRRPEMMRDESTSSNSVFLSRNDAKKSSILPKRISTSSRMNSSNSSTSILENLDMAYESLYGDNANKVDLKIKLQELQYLYNIYNQKVMEYQGSTGRPLVFKSFVMRLAAEEWQENKVTLSETLNDMASLQLTNGDVDNDDNVSLVTDIFGEEVTNELFFEYDDNEMFDYDDFGDKKVNNFNDYDNYKPPVTIRPITSTKQQPRVLKMPSYGNTMMSPSSVKPVMSVTPYKRPSIVIGIDALVTLLADIGSVFDEETLREVLTPYSQ